MKIQVINHSQEGIHGEIVYRKMAMPDSLDEFDINIIDISDEKIWYNNTERTTTLNCINDFISIREMVANRKSSRILYVLPQDVTFHFSTSRRNEGGKTKYIYQGKRLKDNLIALQQSILPNIIPLTKQDFPDVVFENTKTLVGGREYHAVFYSKKNPNNDVLTQSIGSEKATTIKLKECIYVTTLDITTSDESIIHYVKTMFFAQMKQAKPDWMNSIEFNDDKEQRTRIERQRKIIEEANRQIEDANEILQNNDEYKSILFTNSDELVLVVFRILEQVLQCDLSSFVDVKREDFLIKKEQYTLIGEIKGINSNVRNENLAQLENHYQRYMDKLQDEGKTEIVYKVLLVNPFRSTPLEERKPVNDDQIALAERYGSLIIETKTLLRVYEKFLQGNLTTREMEETIKNKKGILALSDFN